MFETNGLRVFSGMIDGWWAVGLFQTKSVDTLSKADALLSTDIFQAVGVRLRDD